MSGLTPRQRRFVTVAGVVGYLLLSHSLLDAYRDKVPPVWRSRSNLLFARQPTYATAIETFHDRWSPAYPSVLYFARRAGVSPAAVNQGLFWLSVAGFFLVGRKWLRGVNAAGPALLYGLGAFHGYNLAQFSSEALIVPLGLAVYALLLEYRSRPAWGAALAIAVVTSAACLSRTFAVLWLGPIVGVVIAAADAPRRTKWAHGLIVAAVVLLPVGLWTKHVHDRTGFLTGMDRSSWDTRRLPPSVEHWRESTGPADNAVAIAKTLYVDFLSPSRHATHEVITPSPREGRNSVTPGRRVFFRSLDDRLEFGAVEAAVMLVAAGALGGLGFAGWRGRRLPQADDVGRSGSSGRLSGEAGAGGGGWRWLAAPGGLAALFFFTYVVEVHVLWSLGNADPIYSRFLYPSYPWLVLAGSFGYASVARDGLPRVRMAGTALWLLVIGVQLVKAARFLLDPGGS